MRPILIICALALALPLDAQRGGREPRRPRLAAGADTNDAQAYLQAGHRVLLQHPGTAVHHYYWAVRIDPTSAAALYSLRTAVLMERPATFRAYMEGSRRVMFSREMRANDSLYFRALQLDPFLHQQHSKTIQFRYWRLVVEADPAFRSEGAGRVDYLIEDMLSRTPPATRARLAAAEGQLANAQRLYTEAIAASKKPAYLYFDRAGVWALQGMHEAAIDDFNRGLTELRKLDADADEDVVFYQAKALYEYAIGLLWARANNVDKAREAFGRAMEEDMSFYPAHLLLARLALATDDTTTALTEIALAADLAPAEAAVHFNHGQLLVQVKQYAEAVPPLKKAIEIEPFYADPYFALGLALAQTGDTAGARTAYEGFLARATRGDRRRGTATNAVRALEPTP